MISASKEVNEHMAQTRVTWLNLFLLSIVLVLSAAILILVRRNEAPQPALPVADASSAEGEARLVKIPPALEDAPRPTTQLVGIGVMGDSNSDEYRGTDNRGGRWADTTLNWIELLARNRNLNFGEWGDWGEPRRTGYKYNWARSAADVRSLINDGQHIGLAEQVANGEVSHVILYIGGNDFHLENGTYREIYDGSLSGARLQRKLDQFMEHLTLAVDTVLSAGDVQMVVVNVADKALAPETINRYPNRSGRQRVSQAIAWVNEQIEVMAAERGIVVVDLNVFAKQTLGRINQQGNFELGGETFILTERGNEPHHLQLGDESGHAGTVLNGLFANALLVEPFNQAFGLDIQPLSDEEILTSAGLR